MSQLKTVEIELPSGNPRDLRLAHRPGTGPVRLIEVPRAQVSKFCDMPESRKPGVYFLLGSADESSRQELYIGQSSGDVGSRIKTHHKDEDKAFWERALVVVSSMESGFTADRTIYLEKISIDRAREAGRFEVKNGNAGSKISHTPDSVKRQCEEFFDEIDFLLLTLGYPVFEPLNKSVGMSGVAGGNEPSEQVFSIKRKDGGVAKGSYGNDGFVMHEGSLVSAKVTDHLSPGYRKIRDDLCASGVLRKSDDYHLVLTKDWPFKSPTAAAALVVGGSANGWTSWKNEKGETLDQVFRPD